MIRGWGQGPRQLATLEVHWTCCFLQTLPNRGGCLLSAFCPLLGDSLCVRAAVHRPPPLPPAADRWVSCPLSDDCACKGEEGGSGQGGWRRQVPEPEPSGLIPPGGRALIVVTCEAKYVLLGFQGFDGDVGTCISQVPCVVPINSICSSFDGTGSKENALVETVA